MQHVVNIAFDFDDNRIKTILENTTVEKVQKDIRQAVIDNVFSKRGWGTNSHANPETDPLQEWAKCEVRNLLLENKEYICKLAAKELAQSMTRSSKWKNQIVEEVKSNE